MIELLHKKEKPPFDEVYQSWYQRVLRYIYKKVGNLHDAEDIAGDVFLYCWDHYDNYDPDKSKISTWLFLVAGSRIKNHYRDAKSTVPFDSLINMASDDCVDMDECLYWEAVFARVEQAIGQLDERKQKIIRMKYFEGKTGDEIADILGTTPGNVRVLLSRAINTLEKTCADIIEGG